MFIQIMEKLKNRGFTLIEVVVSIAMFFIIIFSAFNIKILSIKLREKEKNYNSFLLSTEALRNIILNNYSYGYINSLEGNIYYISTENLNSENVFNKELGVLDYNKPQNSPFMSIEVYSKAGEMYVKCKYFYGKNKSICEEFMKGKLNEKRNDSN